MTVADLSVEVVMSTDAVRHSAVGLKRRSDTQSMLVKNFDEPVHTDVAAASIFHAPPIALHVGANVDCADLLCL